MSEEALQKAEKRREAKGKGEKEGYTHLNVEFQIIARRNKKAFLRDQCKEIEENNTVGKTRDFFKKIRDTKGTFHVMMGTMKDRKNMDETEVADIKKRWQEYTEELYKKDLHDSYNHNGVITYLESNLLECKVKWALGSNTVNKASGGDGIPPELFQNLKDDAVSAALNMPVNLETFSSVAQVCLTLCNPMNCSTPGLPVHHKLLEFTQTHAHRVSDAIQPSCPLSSPSLSAPNPSQHQGLFQ